MDVHSFQAHSLRFLLCVCVSECYDVPTTEMVPQGYRITPDGTKSPYAILFRA